MTFDKPDHQSFIIELLKQASFPGHLVDLVYEVKQSVIAATISGGSPEQPESQPPEE